jgi:hypothetical protein
MWIFNNAADQQLFTQALRDPLHTTVAKAVLLNTAFKPVEGGDIYDRQTNEITNFITDGSVDVDTDRGTRRTSEITLLNPSSEFTPATENFDPEGPWVGKIYLNRIVRLFRGIRVGGRVLYAPIGTFMIDNADVILERNISMVVLTMSDLWKKLSKSFAAKELKWLEGTPINTVIRDLTSAAGADYPLSLNLDPLASRSNADKRLNKNFKMEEGSSRGDALLKIRQRYDIDIFFDVSGRFTTQDRKAARDRTPVWHFYSSPDNRGMLVSTRRSFNDDNLYNHVVVIGTENEKNIIRVQRKDTDPRSKTNIDLVGDRVFLIRNDRIGTVAQAQRALDRAWSNRFGIAETMSLETICNPLLDGDDVIRVTEKNFIKIDGHYRLARFSIPLVTSRQELNASNILRREDL